jgi:hypothetical protein
MIARAFWTTCVVAAFCAAGAGADAARVARVHVARPPALKVGTSCEAAGSGSVVAGPIKNADPLESDLDSTSKRRSRRR